MASLCLSAINVTTGPPMVLTSSSSSSSSSSNRLRCCLISVNPMRQHRKTGRSSQVVRMAPQGERMTHYAPLGYPFDYERPGPPRRADIFPKFRPMKTPLPIPMPTDPPLQDDDFLEEEEEEEEEENPEEEEDYP